MGRGKLWSKEEKSALAPLALAEGLVTGQSGPVKLQQLFEQGRVPEILIGRGYISCSRYITSNL